MERGIPLPPLGSFQFNLLSESLERRRAEKFAFAKFISGFLAPMSGLSAQDTALLLADYGEELHQLKYNYGYETVRDRIEQMRVVKKLEELQLLEKVSKLTVED